jgi:hypothetical protein
MPRPSTDCDGDTTDADLSDLEPCLSIDQEDYVTEEPPSNQTRSLGQSVRNAIRRLMGMTEPDVDLENGTYPLIHPTSIPAPQIPESEESGPEYSSQIHDSEDQAEEQGGNGCYFWENASESIPYALAGGFTMYLLSLRDR